MTTARIKQLLYILSVKQYEATEETYMSYEKSPIRAK